MDTNTSFRSALYWIGLFHLVCYFRADRFAILRKISLPVLSFVWCLGLSCGFWLVTPAEPFSTALMYAFVSERGSIFGLLVVNLLPILISALVVRYQVIALVLPIAFFKAFLVGFCYSCVLCAFASAGWLICLLTLFSQSISAVLLLWFWIRNIDRTGSWHFKELLLLGIIGLVFSVAAHYLFRPMAMALIMES